MITIKNPITVAKEKIQAMRVAKQAGRVQELAEIKGNGAANTYVSAEERAWKKKRKAIAKKSRRRNRK